MTILGRLWPFKKWSTPEQMNQECPGSGSLWEGKYRRTRCSTSNGLECHLPGGYQASLRYFACCPECKIERAITKGKRLFVKHTRSPDYHPSHLHLQKYALERESRLGPTKVREDRNQTYREPSPRPMTAEDLLEYEKQAERRREIAQEKWEAGWKAGGAVIHRCGKPILQSVKGGEELEMLPGNGGTGRWYCTCELTTVPKPDA
jgi:hypothetical protein